MKVVPFNYLNIPKNNKCSLFHADCRVEQIEHNGALQLYGFQKQYIYV